jgi:diaminopimelate epimerase
MERIFKYHGLGNDFIVLDRRESGGEVDPFWAKKLCERQFGIGADGVLVVLPSPRALARMVVHNADGSIAEMCGNGIRCVVKFLLDRSDEKPDHIEIETAAGVLPCAVKYGSDGQVAEVQVSMGPASLVAMNLPSGKTGKPFVTQALPGTQLKGTAISMGNPHLVIFDAPLEEAKVLGPQLEQHPDFPSKTNVELCRFDGEVLRVVVWERGSGLTQACGTGACAAAAAAAYEKRIPFEKWVWVALPGGKLQIFVAPDLAKVEMRGPATFVFEGVVPKATSL